MLRFLQQGNFLFSVELKSCGELFIVWVGRGVLAQVVKSEEGPDQFVYNALLRRRQGEGVGFDGFTLTAVSPVCARINALSGGREIHAQNQMVKSVVRPNVFAVNSLMDIYAKCGVADYTRRIFDGMGRRYLRSWNAVLYIYAIARRMEDGFKLFNEMLGSGFSLNTVTFDALVSGCSHMGLTKDGETLFHRMRTEFGISPTPSVEHYACLVDVLGRAGRLKEAEALGVVKNMHQKPKNYVVLLNIYENAGLWEGVKMVREMMENHGIKKEVGCSWIEIKSRFHTFVAGGDPELGSSEDYQKLWSEFKEAMRGIGYEPDNGVVLHDVYEEIKKAWICGHSERLASMFGLIHSGSGISLRITKNLCVCADCHSWMKTVSQVLREMKHFRHFEKGSCSCKDYW
ncbi:hypothetical protein RHGRI_030228 [Rhododendron griersonianum]|uniref:DYW domain-containing protein n=1 Tax=Rhododendron griersonianum TaxID=479676 RepID=A0AAV6IN98_9ERIC|nr:hypothetical protein RHGRI_030228 [Rhododendron griersonianum]